MDDRQRQRLINNLTTFGMLMHSIAIIIIAFKMK